MCTCNCVDVHSTCILVVVRCWLDDSQLLSEQLVSVSRLHTLRKVEKGLHNKIKSEKRPEVGKYTTKYWVVSTVADI